MYRDVLFNFFLQTNKRREIKTHISLNTDDLNMFHNALAVHSVSVNQTYLRGVSSMASSSSCSHSQSHWAFRFLFLHSHPRLWPVLVPSAASSGPWEGDWNLELRLPISTFSNRRNRNQTIFITSRSAVLQQSGDQYKIRKQTVTASRLSLCWSTLLLFIKTLNLISCASFFD